jgi:hypothetical protein
MKKIILSCLTASLIILAGCKSNGGDPKMVLSEFFDALARKDFISVKKHSTKDSEGMLNMVQMGMDKISDSSQMMQYKKDNLELGDAVITGDKAIVPVKDKKSGETTDFVLKKEDGEWEVAFDKSTLMEMAQKKMKEHGMDGMGGMGRMGSMGSMDDSSGNMNNGSMQNMDSVTKEEMQQARKMIDSARKMQKDQGK